MKPRFNLAIAPEAYRAMAGLEGYLKRSGLEPNLLHMIKLRASQINGCAYCIDMHWKDARAVGETEQRLYGLSAWEESPYYTERERAALAWTEALTNLADGHVSDAAYDAARRPDLGRRHDQRLESRRDRQPRRAGEVHAGAARVGGSYQLTSAGKYSAISSR
jgi:AhpD family alkylhydroperoxidase